MDSAKKTPPTTEDWRMLLHLLSTYAATGASQASERLVKHKDVPVLTSSSVGVWLLLDRLTTFLLDVKRKGEGSVSARKVLVTLVASSTGAMACRQITSLPNAPAPLALVNKILWTRVAAAVKSVLRAQGKLGVAGVALITQLAIGMTFFGIMLEPNKSSRMIHKMCEKFIGQRFFDSIRNVYQLEHATQENSEPVTTINGKTLRGTGQVKEESQKQFKAIGKYSNPTRVLEVFWESFRGLLWFNSALHMAAAVISSAVQKRNLPDRARIVKAATEMISLNLIVALSTSAWVGCAHTAWHLVETPSKRNIKIIALFGAIGATSPLVLIKNPTLIDNFYTMFLPWGLGYGLYDTKLDHRALFVAGNVSSALLADYASNSWIGQVLFQTAVKHFSRRTSWSQ